ncbi:MAG: hypothetical protein Q9162_000884 [Coniocarpon cinnabarinum]
MKSLNNQCPRQALYRLHLLNRLLICFERIREHVDIVLKRRRLEQSAVREVSQYYVEKWIDAIFHTETAAVYLNPSPDHPKPLLGICAGYELCNDTEIITSAFESSPQVCVAIFRRAYDVAVSQNDLILNDTVADKSVPG